MNLIERLRHWVDKFDALEILTPEAIQMRQDAIDAISALSAPLPGDIEISASDLRGIAREDSEMSGHPIEEHPAFIAADMLERLARELAQFQQSSFNPDWSLLDAAQQSLREHMALVSKLQSRIDEGEDDE